MAFLASFNSIAGQKKSCIDRVACYDYNDGRSMFSFATTEEHNEDRAIADYVYIRIALYDSEGKRHAYTNVADYWYRSVRSDYSFAPAEDHIRTRKANYEKAKKACFSKIDELLWEHEECAD